MQEFFLARQPIVDQHEKLFAFELLFRSGRVNSAGVVNEMLATAEVLVGAFGEMGLAEVLGSHKGFINVDSEFLHSDMVELLPKEQVVLELLESIHVDAAVVARCRELKKKGYSLALDDVVELREELKPLLGIVDLVKLDLMQIEPARLSGLVAALKEYPPKLLAEKVERREEVSLCQELGFEYFQGYYFAHPELLSGKRVSPSKMALLRILTLMLEDAANEEIEEAFKGYPHLSYSLMRMVNSAAAGLINKINSLRHGLVMLGRRPLRRWVQLLLYTSEGGGEQTISPLMQLAATRGKLMELVAQQQRPRDRDYADRAFMAGILSLLDVVLDTPLPEVIPGLHLHEAVEAALLAREGELGALLTLCENLEAPDLVTLNAWLARHPGLTLASITRAELDALAWANSITM
ncbi:MAG: EAL domain-containing protein [Nitrosomonadales bacterium]|nr:EAL domain-containing protein [Nitrosomonadales bacterium]